MGFQGDGGACETGKYVMVHVHVSEMVTNGPWRTPDPRHPSPIYLLRFYVSPGPERDGGPEDPPLRRGMDEDWEGDFSSPDLTASLLRERGRGVSLDRFLPVPGVKLRVSGPTFQSLVWPSVRQP